MKPFSIKEIIRRAWELFAAQWGTFYGTFGVLIVLNVAFSMATEQVGQKSVGGIVITIFSTAVAVVVQLGLYRIWLDMVRGKEARVDQMFSEYRLAFRYFGATLVYMAVVCVGLLLLVVPGVIFAIKYSYYGYAMIDRKLGVFDSLKLSAKITEGAKWNILGLWITLGALIIVSIIPLGLGLIVTLPMGMVVGAIVYDRLLIRFETSATFDGEVVGTTPTADAPAPFVPLDG